MTIKKYKRKSNGSDNRGSRCGFLIYQSDAMGITGELLVDIIILLKAYWAEQELHYKEKRTREGIEKAKKNGTKFGRQAIAINEKQFCREVDRAIARHITHKEAMRNLGLKD